MPDAAETCPSDDTQAGDTNDIAAGAGAYGDYNVIDDILGEKRPLLGYIAAVICGCLLAALGAIIVSGRNKKR
ncbi:hypothetical protein [Huintestinicola sp.]|uniref:hypothetical protein n=1 Tax=Huintestinicola sp. TaxID=2981661 RepID=UPI003D7E9A17